MESLAQFFHLAFGQNFLRQELKACPNLKPGVDQTKNMKFNGIFILF